MKRKSWLLCLLLVLGGCEVHLNQLRELQPGQIYVEDFQSADITTGKMVAQEIRDVFRKKHLLTDDPNRSDYLLTGTGVRGGWSGTQITFSLKDLQGIEYISGRGESEVLVTSPVSREIAKKISAKIPKKDLTKQSNSGN